MQPRKPSLNVLPQPLFTGSSLMKPTGTLKQTVEGLEGGFQFSAGALGSRASIGQIGARPKTMYFEVEAAVSALRQTTAQSNYPEA